MKGLGNGEQWGVLIMYSAFPFRNISFYFCMCFSFLIPLISSYPYIFFSDTFILPFCNIPVFSCLINIISSCISLFLFLPPFTQHTSFSPPYSISQDIALSLSFTSTYLVSFPPPFSFIIPLFRFPLLPSLRTCRIPHFFITSRIFLFTS